MEKDTCRDYVLPRLTAAGWSEDQIQEQFPITDGRIIAVGDKHRRGEALRADYVLEYRPGVPVAVVEAKRAYAIRGKGLQQAKRYAHLLDVPFAYSTNGRGIVEDDRDTGRENDRLTAFPSPDELWSRYRAWKGIVEDSAAAGLVLPFNRSLRNADGSVKEPRYYQRTSINRAVSAILAGEKRLLLTMATGTGKTFVSMQIVWKLWNTGWRPGRNTTQHFERVVSLLSRTEAAARHLTDYLRRTDRWAKTIVFCVNQEHADQMRRALHNANADLARRHPNYVVRIVSEEGELGRGYLSDFADTERHIPVIATTSQLLSTGVDLPTVRNIVLFRPVGSIALFKQMIGRGTRLFPDEDKLSFDIIDYSGATGLFADSEFDGPPERVDVEEIDDEGNVVVDAVVEEPVIGFEPGDDETTTPDELDSDVRARFYVDEVEVWVTAEAIYHLDPGTQRLRLVEYRDFVTDTVRTLFPDAHELRCAWTSRVGRQEVVETLAHHGIDVDELANRTGLVDTDPLDLLVHIAWNLPLATRSDRARRVRKEHADFFEAYQPAARTVLAHLLDKYTEHGVSQLDDLGVLEVPPLSSLGSPAEIAVRFGSPDELRIAVGKLGERLYAA